MQKLPNQNAPLVDIQTGKIVPPWNSFFQSFSQAPNPVLAVVVGASPFAFTPNIASNVVITGGTVSAIVLSRGGINITLPGPIVPISIADTVTVTWSFKPTIQILPDLK